MSARPIADYAMLSDCHTAALVSRDGAIEWYCLPRFDGPSLFGRLLDPDGGHWSLAPSERADATRRYLPRTLILETTFRTASGTAVLEDGLAMEWRERHHDHGTHAPRILLRRLRCTEGELAFSCDFCPRPEYGRIHPVLEPNDGGVRMRGGADVLQLSSPLPICPSDGAAVCTFRLRKGDELCFALHHRASWEAPPRALAQDEISRWLDDTIEGWRSWAGDHQAYEGPWRESVHLGGRVLHALTYQPTGAIVAAPTTSLPETPGGVRNWDYRYTWLRDASLTLDALWVAACPDEASAFFDFVAGAALGMVRKLDELQIMYGIGGEHDLFERTLPHLAGWRGSQPVRIGNAAWEQRQLDVYGELLTSADLLRDHLLDASPTTKELLCELAEGAAAYWRMPDQGIWEVRGEPRHFLHSKLMCWAALDRAIGLASILGANDRIARWADTRDEIRRAIEHAGYSETAGAFTQAFGSDKLDASALLIPMVGFLPPTDPRVLSTIHAVERDLSDRQGLVYRYLADDGLPGEEGSFLLCTFWLARAQALAGELPGARATFERAAAWANDVGLLAEEVDATSGELLGNFPQAFSHIGLIDAAWAISQAEQGNP